MELDPKYDDYDFPTKAPVEAPGHPGYLKPEEQAQLHQLRLMLEAEGYTKRLDTLTLVSLLKCRAGWRRTETRRREGGSWFRGASLANGVGNSFGSSAPASSTSWPPRRCKIVLPTIGEGGKGDAVRRHANLLAGSSTPRSGGRRRSSTSSSPPGSSLRRPRCSSTTRSTTTRPIRYDIPFPFPPSSLHSFPSHSIL